MAAQVVADWIVDHTEEVKNHAETHDSPEDPMMAMMRSTAIGIIAEFMNFNMKEFYLLVHARLKEIKEGVS